jgi:hypothetical protein
MSTKQKPLSWLQIAKRAKARHSDAPMPTNAPTARTAPARGILPVSLTRAQAGLLTQLVNASVELLAEELPDVPSPKQWRLVRDAQRLQIELSDQLGLVIDV